LPGISSFEHGQSVSSLQKLGVEAASEQSNGTFNRNTQMHPSSPALAELQSRRRR
jgi:hypothetical protein